MHVVEDAQSAHEIESLFGTKMERVSNSELDAIEKTSIDRVAPCKSDHLRGEIDPYCTSGARSHYVDELASVSAADIEHRRAVETADALHECIVPKID